MTDTLGNLPPRAREIADVIGIDGLLSLVEHYGGTPVRVHTEQRPSSALAACLGAEAYRKLQATYPSEYIEVPLLHTGRDAVLAADVCDSRARGEMIRTIARRHKITMRRVYRILSRERDRINERQGVFEF